MYYIKELSKGNADDKKLKCLGNESNDEDWNKREEETLAHNTEEESEASWSKPDKSNTERRVCEERDFWSIINEKKDILMEGDGRQIMYAVVTLQDSDEVMVVASNWLTPDKKQSYWPPFKSTEKCMEAVKNRLEPETGGKTWEKINISFHKDYGFFDEATEGQKEIIELKEQYNLLATGFPGILRQSTQDMSKNPVLPTPSTSRRPADGKNDLLQMLKDIKSTVQENSSMLKKLLKDNPSSEAPSSTSLPTRDVKTSLNLPLRTIEDVLRTERELSNTAKRHKYVQYLSRLGGFGPEDVIKNIMQRVLTDDLAKEFNWQGRGDKKPFSKLILADVIKEAASKQSVMRADCETEIKKYLWTGIDRKRVCGGTKRKLDQESSDSDSSIESPLTDMEIMLKAKPVMKRVTDNLVHTVIMHKDIMSKINKMNNVSKKATIGIFGKSGEGKSSLLSAVLGTRYLLPSGCFGACTAVVTQVEANLTDSNYTAEIELFSNEEWEKELRDLFRVLSDESEDRDDDMLEIAVEKITALYGDDADKKTLEKLKNDDKFSEIKDFLSINKRTISNNDVSKFSSDVAPYILHSEASTGGWYWPLVKSVTFKVPDGHDLLEHIVLVDIPGTGDCNKLRDDKWKSKLRECSFVWIVSDIKRATTDKDPWGILKHCIEELGPGGECKRINFICTKTDDINPPAYIRSARLTISEDKDQKKVCILHRNEHAKTRVKDKFENSEIKKRFSTDDNLLNVFTVSSKAFFEHDLNMEPSETEIPKLRDDLRILNKNINRELTSDYVNEARGVLSLIQSVQLDRDKKTEETKVKVCMELENNLKKALNELDSRFDTIYTNLEKFLSRGVEESVQLCVASTKAIVAPDIDKRGFHKILQALCKNGGCYWSKNWDVIIDLNRQLAKHLQEYINEYFNLIFPVTGTTLKSVQEQIDKFSIIQSDPGSPILHHIQNFIKTEETKLKASLKREVVDRKKDIYSSIQTTIEKQMSPYYEQAAAVTGIGSMKKRQELLITAVDEIKHDMFNKAKFEMLKNFNNLKMSQERSNSWRDLQSNCQTEVIKQQKAQNMKN
ncbi:nuclear GTPase SLIP-GC-like isoform X2 [Pimephales promelas]|uniref:nuclear GTPase SLIP-GC-like isoform X2 n=1 Tax=Pimephales promelas TaxID=90988 RepID=UPI001955D743|nr:nuclear GTPase SLIP-GC-like isoform X2 [Pimephales promelas]